MESISKILNVHVQVEIRGYLNEFCELLWNLESLGLVYFGCPHKRQVWRNLLHFGENELQKCMFKTRYGQTQFSWIIVGISAPLIVAISFLLQWYMLSLENSHWSDCYL